MQNSCLLFIDLIKLKVTCRCKSSDSEFGYHMSDTQAEDIDGRPNPSILLKECIIESSFWFIDFCSLDIEILHYSQQIWFVLQ